MKNIQCTKEHIRRFFAMQEYYEREYKFSRQHAFKRYIIDFYCHELKLCIELDGEIHEVKAQKEYDEMRTQHLLEFGLEELRYQRMC
jgi:very-short-patch-repair endonuclease